MIETLLYFIALGLISAVIAYTVLFRVIPKVFAGKSRTPASVAHAPVHAPAHPPAPAHPAPHAPAATAPRSRFSAREGFRSFGTVEELTVEDIVKGLSREN